MPSDVFHPVYVESRGRPQIGGDLVAAGANGTFVWELSPQMMVPLPDGADILSMPGRSPLALDPVSGEAVVIEGSRKRAMAVAAALPIGYTRLLVPAAEDDGQGPDLPLFGYTAVAELQGLLYVAAVRTDDPAPWMPLAPGCDGIDQLVAARKEEFPGNRILAQLAHCVQAYHCRTAQNLFTRQGEAGLPSAASCNASCLGCISLQPSGCCPAPQGRITFMPTESELVELAVAHLTASPEAMISFGQGCEGEPLTMAPILAQVIKQVRRQTDSGTINLNTNGGRTRALAEMVEAGLDSVRVSLFSAIPRFYEAYHRPRDYRLSDVVDSIRLAVSAGCRASLNLLVYPGFTDAAAQKRALIELCRETGLHQLQLRNLNLDPRWMKRFLGRPATPGLLSFLDEITRELPGVAVGNYSRAC